MSKTTQKTDRSNKSFQILNKKYKKSNRPKTGNKNKYKGSRRKRKKEDFSNNNKKKMMIKSLISVDNLRADQLQAKRLNVTFLYDFRKNIRTQS